MLRVPRPVASLVPHHVIHRGNNRQTIFARTDDFQYYLACLRLAQELHSCLVYAYILMTNHVHLFVEPSEALGLSWFLKRVHYSNLERFYGK